MSERVLDTAVIPLAGLGSRMWPATEGGPKFMLPVIDGDLCRPNIDFALDDCIGAGIKNIVFVTNADGKEVLAKYIAKSMAPDREQQHRHLDKIEQLEKEMARRAVFASMNIEYITQPMGEERYGTAVPLSLARGALAGVKYFALAGGDDFVWHPDGTSELSLALQTWNRHGTDHALMGKPVPREEGSSYGILQVDGSGRLIKIDEKPPEERLPQEPLANISRYILSGGLIWDYLDEELRRPRADDQPEYYVTDVINAMITGGGQTFQSHPVQGTYLDAGTPQSILYASNHITRHRLQGKTE